MLIKDFNRFWSGFAIFPCKGGTKIPATPHGFKDAFRCQDAGNIVKQGFNAAMSCEMSNVVVIDLDYHEKNSTAEEDIKALEIELNSKLPKTLTQATASGKGKHLIFSNKVITKPRGKIGKYCDVKYSGYIMIAPSIYNGRRYEIIDGVDDSENPIIAELPQPWIDYLNTNSGIKKSQYKNSSYKNNKRPLNLSFNDEKIKTIFEQCGFLRHCMLNAQTLSEPEWFSMVTILAQIEGSDDLIHELSTPYPRYCYEETQQKIDNARKFGHPHTCNYLMECYPDICENCSREIRR